jgi:hypothetical protein
VPPADGVNANVTAFGSSRTMEDDALESSHWF